MALMENGFWNADTLRVADTDNFRFHGRGPFNAMWLRCNYTQPSPSVKKPPKHLSEQGQDNGYGWPVRMRVNPANKRSSGGPFAPLDRRSGGGR